MGALLIEAFVNNEIYTLIKFILMGNQFFVSNSFRDVSLYPTADRNRCIYSMKFEFCF